MIKFKVVQHGSARTIVHELGTLVEKRGVVLVSLDYKGGYARAFALAVSLLETR